MLNVRAAADAVAERFVSELPVRSADLREVFADDLEERAESLRDGVRFLADNTVSDPAKIVEGAELSAYYSADEELLELQDQFDLFALVESGVTEPSEEWIKRAQEAMVRHRERMNELERQHNQRVTLGLIDRASTLEGYVEEAVFAVDREIQRQIDIAGGK